MMIQKEMLLKNAFKSVRILVYHSLDLYPKQFSFRKESIHSKSL